MDLRKLVEPVIEKFVEELQKIKNTELERIDELQKHIERTKEEHLNLRAQMAENDKRTSAKLYELDKQKQDLQRQKDLITTEVKRYNDLERLTEQHMKKAEDNLKDAEMERKLAAETLKAAQNKLTQYEQKLSTLHDEDIKLDDKRRKISEKEREIRIKGEIIDKDQQKINEQNELLKERELDTKIKEKRIDLEQKRIKADE